MTHLNCGVDNCVHNSDDYCCINSIEIAGAKAKSSASTCCDSFEEATGEFTNSMESPSPSLDIKCKAETCMYNCDCHCEAEHVDISGQAACDCEETECSTFCCE